MGGFEGRSSLRTWLFRITTHACIRLGERRSRRLLSRELGPAGTDVHDLGELIDAPLLEPWLETPDEVADVLDTTPAAVNRALQRPRAAMATRVPPRSQQAERAALGDDRTRRLVDELVAAWHRADVDGLVALLADDVRFTMPPLPAWFAGRDAVARFLAERVFATPWRLVPAPANGQPAVLGYQDPGDGVLRLSGVTVLSLRDGSVDRLASFLDPALHRLWDVSQEIVADDR